MTILDLNSFLFGLVTGCLATMFAGIVTLAIFVRPFVAAAAKQRQHK